MLVFFFLRYLDIFKTFVALDVLFVDDEVFSGCLVVVELFGVLGCCLVLWEGVLVGEDYFEDGAFGS